MERAFSHIVAGQEWRRDASDWIAAHIPGHVRIEALTQPRIRPWSTQLIVDTDAGRFWFKALPPGAAHEAALRHLLAELAPDDVTPPLAIDTARGWILDTDLGATWGDTRTATTGDWQNLMTRIASVQQRLARHREPLLAAQLPDCRPELILERFDRFTTVFASLDADHPCYLDTGTRAELHDSRPRVQEAAHRLIDSQLPVTLQHGDVHPGNIFATADGLRLFDFGDAQWAHALEVLIVPRAIVESEGIATWEPVLASYCAAWDLSPAELADDLAAASLTQPIHRCLTWWRALASASAAEWVTWGQAPRQHLTRVIGHA